MEKKEPVLIMKYMWTFIESDCFCSGEEETICQQCGEKGFEDLFVYCVKCLNFAVHYYCLPDIPETFDKLINWFCDDCEPKSTKQSPPVKPSCIPSMENDPVISRNVKAVHSKIKSKKQIATCCVMGTEEHKLSCDLKVGSCVATEENRHRCSPVLQPESDNRNALADSTQLVGDCQPGSINKISMADSMELVGDPVISGSVEAVHSKIKSKKRDATCRVVETEEHRLPCDLKASSCMATEEEKRHRCSPVCQPGSNNKVALADSSELVGDPYIPASVKAVHSIIKSKKQDATCKGVETEEHRFPCDLKASSCMATEDQCSPIRQPESNNRLALADSKKFVGVPVISKSAKAVHPKIKSQKQDATCRGVETEEQRVSCDLKASSCVDNEEKRHRCSLIYQPDSANWPALVDSTKLVGDPVISESAEPVCPKIKSKKQDGSCMVVETEGQRLSHDPKVSNCMAAEEKRHRNSPVLQLGSDNKTALVDFMNLAGNYSLKSKLNIGKGATQTVVKIGNQMKEGGSSQRNSVAERAPLAGARPALKRKLKRKKKYFIPSVTETKEHKYPNPTQRPSRSHKEPSQSKGVQSWSDDLENDVALGRGRTMILEDGSVLSKMARSESIRNTDSQISSGDLSLGACNYQPAQPVVNPIWRGSFSTRNKLNGLFEGIAGHLSNKACPMVCEAADFLQRLLCLEVLPKTAVWPKSFQKSEPCDDNIALYFFPLNRSYESVFNHLVDVMMEQELAMRTTVRNAELLIFTSSKLPRRYWTFQGRYYLWGVFRAKQASSSHPVNAQRITQLNSYGVGAGERNVQSPRIWLPGVP